MAQSDLDLALYPGIGWELRLGAGTGVQAPPTPVTPPASASAPAAAPTPAMEPGAAPSDAMNAPSFPATE